MVQEQHTPESPACEVTLAHSCQRLGWIGGRRRDTGCSRATDDIACGQQPGAVHPLPLRSSKNKAHNPHQRGMVAHTIPSAHTHPLPCPRAHTSAATLQEDCRGLEHTGAVCAPYPTQPAGKGALSPRCPTIWPAQPPLHLTVDCVGGRWTPPLLQLVCKGGGLRPASSDAAGLKAMSSECAGWHAGSSQGAVSWLAAHRIKC